MQTRRVEIRTRADALERVAGYVVGDLEAYTQTNIDEETWKAMSPAERERIEWAVDRVQKVVTKMSDQARARADGR